MYNIKDRTSLSKIMTIEDVEYCKINKCWHIPYSSESYQTFKAFCLDFKIIQSNGTIESIDKKATIKKPNCARDEHTVIDSPKESLTVESNNDTQKTAVIRKLNPEGIKITLNKNVFRIDIPYSKRLIGIIKKCKRAYWSASNQEWIVKANVYNLNFLQRSFNYWPCDQFEEIEALLDLQKHRLTVELFVSPKHPKSITVKLKGKNPDFNFMKSIPLRVYDKSNRHWIVPLSEANLRRIKSHFLNHQFEIIDRMPKERPPNEHQKKRNVKKRTDHLLSKFPKSISETMHMYADVLLAQNYSWSTIKTYTGEFAKYLLTKKIPALEERTSKDTNRYLKLIAESSISESQLNQVVSAIKFYYQKVIFNPHFEIENIRRPRKSRPLPVILSITEVDRMFRSLENIKHVAIVYTIYSAGLRREELIRLRLQDIIWERNQIHIVRSKNKKDRYVMLSQTLKDVLYKYINEYKPIYWLFEGMDKKSPYSSSSTLKIVKRAAKKAGITRKVTTHTLRHCFATHLLDFGTDVRFIKELLGHKDIKTTLIYTHVTNQNLKYIESPLDTMGRKLGKKRN